MIIRTVSIDSICQSLLTQALREQYAHLSSDDSGLSKRVGVGLPGYESLR